MTVEIWKTIELTVIHNIAVAHQRYCCCGPNRYLYLVVVWSVEALNVGR